MRGYRVSPYTGDIRVMIGSNRVMNVFSSRLLAPRSHQALLPINAAKAAGEPVALPQLSFTPITRANLKAIKAQISKTLSFEDLSSELENIIHSGSCGSILLAVAVQVVQLTQKRDDLQRSFSRVCVLDFVLRHIHAWLLTCPPVNQLVVVLYALWVLGGPRDGTIGIKDSLPSGDSASKTSTSGSLSEGVKGLMEHYQSNESSSTRMYVKHHVPALSTLFGCLGFPASESNRWLEGIISLTGDGGKGGKKTLQAILWHEAEASQNLELFALRLCNSLTPQKQPLVESVVTDASVADKARKGLSASIADKAREGPSASVADKAREGLSASVADKAREGPSVSVADKARDGHSASVADEAREGPSVSVADKARDGHSASVADKARDAVPNGASGAADPDELDVDEVDSSNPGAASDELRDVLMDDAVDPLIQARLSSKSRLLFDLAYLNDRLAENQKVQPLLMSAEQCAEHIRELSLEHAADWALRGDQLEVISASKSSLRISALSSAIRLNATLGLISLAASSPEHDDMKDVDNVDTQAKHDGVLDWKQPALELIMRLGVEKSTMLSELCNTLLPLSALLRDDILGGHTFHTPLGHRDDAATGSMGSEVVARCFIAVIMARIRINQLGDLTDLDRSDPPDSFSTAINPLIDELDDFYTHFILYHFPQAIPGMEPWEVVSLISALDWNKIRLLLQSSPVGSNHHQPCLTSSFYRALCCPDFDQYLTLICKTSVARIMTADFLVFLDDLNDKEHDRFSHSMSIIGFPMHPRASSRLSLSPQAKAVAFPTSLKQDDYTVSFADTGRSSILSQDCAFATLGASAPASDMASSDMASSDEVSSDMASSDMASACLVHNHGAVGGSLSPPTTLLTLNLRTPTIPTALTAAILDGAEVILTDLIASGSPSAGLSAGDQIQPDQHLADPIYLRAPSDRILEVPSDHVSAPDVSLTDDHVSAADLSAADLSAADLSSSDHVSAADRGLGGQEFLSPENINAPNFSPANDASHVKFTLYLHEESILADIRIATERPDASFAWLFMSPADYSSSIRAEADALQDVHSVLNLVSRTTSEWCDVQSLLLRVKGRKDGLSAAISASRARLWTDPVSGSAPISDLSSLLKDVINLSCLPRIIEKQQGFCFSKPDDLLNIVYIWAKESEYLNLMSTESWCKLFQADVFSMVHLCECLRLRILEGDDTKRQVFLMWILFGALGGVLMAPSASLDEKFHWLHVLFQVSQIPSFSQYSYKRKHNLMQVATRHMLSEDIQGLINALMSSTKYMEILRSYDSIMQPWSDPLKSGGSPDPTFETLIVDNDFFEIQMVQMITVTKMSCSKWDLGLFNASVGMMAWLSQPGHQTPASIDQQAIKCGIYYIMDWSASSDVSSVESDSLAAVIGLLNLPIMMKAIEADPLQMQNVLGPCITKLLNNSYGPNKDLHHCAISQSLGMLRLSRSCGINQSVYEDIISRALVLGQSNLILYAVSTFFEVSHLSVPSASVLRKLINTNSISPSLLLSISKATGKGAQLVQAVISAAAAEGASNWALAAVQEAQSVSMELMLSLASAFLPHSDSPLPPSDSSATLNCINVSSDGNQSVCLGLRLLLEGNALGKAMNTPVFDILLSVNNSDSLPSSSSLKPSRHPSKGIPRRAHKEVVVNNLVKSIWGEDTPSQISIEASARLGHLLISTNDLHLVPHRHFALGFAPSRDAAILLLSHYNCPGMPSPTINFVNALLYLTLKCSWRGLSSSLLELLFHMAKLAEVAEVAEVAKEAEIAKVAEGQKRPLLGKDQMAILCKMLLQADQRCESALQPLISFFEASWAQPQPLEERRLVAARLLDMCDKLHLLDGDKDLGVRILGIAKQVAGIHEDGLEDILWFVQEALLERPQSTIPRHPATLRMANDLLQDLKAVGWRLSSDLLPRLVADASIVIDAHVKPYASFLNWCSSQSSFDRHQATRSPQDMVTWMAPMIGDLCDTLSKSQVNGRCWPLLTHCSPDGLAVLVRICWEGGFNSAILDLMVAFRSRPGKAIECPEALAICCLETACDMGDKDLGSYLLQSLSLSPESWSSGKADLDAVFSVFSCSGTHQGLTGGQARALVNILYDRAKCDLQWRPSAVARVMHNLSNIIEASPHFPKDDRRTLNLVLGVLKAGGAAACDHNTLQPPQSGSNGSSAGLQILDEWLDPAFFSARADKAVHAMVLEPYMLDSAIAPIRPTMDVYIWLMEAHVAAQIPLNTVRVALKILSSEYPSVLPNLHDHVLRTPLNFTGQQDGIIEETNRVMNVISSAGEVTSGDTLSVVAYAMEVSNSSGLYRATALLFQEALAWVGGSLSHPETIKQAHEALILSSHTDGDIAPDLVVEEMLTEAIGDGIYSLEDAKSVEGWIASVEPNGSVHLRNDSEITLHEIEMYYHEMAATDPTPDAEEAYIPHIPESEDIDECEDEISATSDGTFVVVWFGGKAITDSDREMLQYLSPPGAVLQWVGSPKDVGYGLDDDLVRAIKRGRVHRVYIQTRHNGHAHTSKVKAACDLYGVEYIIVSVQRKCELKAEARMIREGRQATGEAS